MRICLCLLFSQPMILKMRQTAYEGLFGSGKFTPPRPLAFHPDELMHSDPCRGESGSSNAFKNGTAPADMHATTHNDCTTHDANMAPQPDTNYMYDQSHDAFGQQLLEGSLWPSPAALDQTLIYWRLQEWPVNQPTATSPSNPSFPQTITHTQHHQALITLPSETTD